MPLYLTENRTGNFHDITTDADVNAYVTQQMKALKQQNVNVGDTILQVFNFGGSQRLFGTDKDPARADVTPSDRSVLIQIQQNRIRPSPTYASLTVDVSVRGYLNLDGVPLPLALWPSDFNLDKINKTHNKKQRKTLIERINKVGNVFNTARAGIKGKITGLPADFHVYDVGTVPADQIAAMHPLAIWLRSFKTNYIALRDALATYRTQQVTARQIAVGRLVIDGLNRSLCSTWQREKGKSAAKGTKSSVTLRFK